METRAPFVVVGAFVLAAILAVFGFVYWLHNTGGLGPRATYHVQFEGSVPGLLVGAAVLFNGIRVGEVTDLGLAPDSPRRVNATISVASTTPVRSDTKVGLEFQGLTGVPVIALEGGMLVANSGEVPTLIAESGAGRSMTQAARDALLRVDTVLSENSGPLKDTIANLKIFSEGLARNTGKLDGIIAGVRDLVAELPEPPVRPRDAARAPVSWLAVTLPDGVPALAMHRWGPAEEGAARAAMGQLSASLPVARDGRTLVLGDEELMYLPQLLAAALGGQVRTSTTTRTPAVTIDGPGYPLRTALRFASTEDGRRPVYAYNVAASSHPEPGNAPGFDHIVLVTDAARGPRTAQLAAELAASARRSVHVINLRPGDRRAAQ